MADPFPVYDFDLLFNESEEEISKRILEPFVTDADPERRFSTREGSFLSDFVAVTSLEFMRAYDRLNQAAAVSFLTAATGDYLDQKGVELNLLRKGANEATVNVTIEGSEGVVIPSGTRFTTVTTGDEESVPVEFATAVDYTIPASGVVLAAATCTVAGDVGNVSANTVTQMVDIVDGVSFVTNEFPSSGGLDEEIDDDYRGRLVEVLRAAGGPGTKADYRVWVKEVLGVDDAIVFPHWAGGGTVKVVIIGPDRTVPTTLTLRLAQDYLDPSVALLTSMETDEGWTGATFATSSKSEGTTSLQIDVPQGQTVKAAVEQIGHLDFITSSDVFDLWVDVVSGLSNVSYVRFQIKDDVGLIAYRQLLATDLVIGPQAIAWTMAQMTVPGSFDWANLTEFSIEVQATAGGPVSLRADSWRVRDANGGVGQGKAPIGAQVTVSSARLLPVSVAAEVIPAPGYTVTGLQPFIFDNIAAYLATREASAGFLFVSEIANAINDTQGVQTYYNVRLNGQPTDLLTDAVDVPIIVTLDLTV